MALYLGNQKVALLHNNDHCILKLNTVLISLDKLLLTDINGLCLIPADTSIIVENILPENNIGLLLSKDNYLLMDANSVFLLSKEV